MERCGNALKVYSVGVLMCPTGDGVDAGFVVDVEEGHENLLDSRTIYGGTKVDELAWNGF